MRWRSLAAQEADPRNAKAQKRLVDAYHEVFKRDHESVEMVLADLANFCGFYKVPPPGTTADQLQYDAGLRAAFGRLFAFLSLPDEQLEALEKAAREEAAADEERQI